MNYTPRPILLIIRKAAVVMKHLRVFHSLFQLDPGLVRPETTVSVFSRESFLRKAINVDVYKKVSMRAECKCTTYEKEPQFSKVLNQRQASSSSVLPPTPPVHSSSSSLLCSSVHRSHFFESPPPISFA